jgi:lysosomal acid phosphatase
MSNVLGVIVIVRNGDRVEYYQNPNDYEATSTETTALGEASSSAHTLYHFVSLNYLSFTQVQSHQLGSLLRSVYLDRNSPSCINNMRSDLVNNREIHVRVKAGGEGTVVFDSAIALLQGLFPPNPNNKIILANETTIVAPMGGYQYVPGRFNCDRDMSGTDCNKSQHCQSWK